MTEAKPQNYWISPTALKITLNALSDADYIQASAASGAMIMCYMKGIDGLEYDHGHNYKRWPLRIVQTYFTSTTKKYVYIRIPRSGNNDTDVAQVVFPSERIDLYGMTESGRQVGNASFYYIYTQGIISASEPTAEGLRRRWEQDIVTGTLASDEATDAGGTGEWWKYDPITDMVTFLKTIASATFEYLKAAQAEIHNLSVTGIFDAMKGYIDDLRSHNYQSGMLDGTGFRLTSDNGEGASELEVDLLKVRKKATFMELEVREETFVGGNQHYSPAGSIIYRVEYMDMDDQVLGYSVMKVPFLLRKFAFLGRMFNYAARKRIRLKLSDEEWRRVHHFRCYLIADDGTTATRNWWKVGDQPRCQTFNKAVSAQNKRDNGYNWKQDHFNEDPSSPMPKYTTTEGPFETSYYWRLVTNVGSEKLEDDRAYDFVDMPYEGWDVTIGGVRHHYTDDEKRSFRDAGSGIPVAGDTIVCMGNRTDQERMNMISLYTSGSENNPPAIKGYRGIHTFSINPENKVFEISPNEFLIRSRMFKLLDDSGYQFPVPLERGEWQQGVRYHWYDRVSWQGCIWLCQVVDDYVWEDAAGNNYEEYRVTDIDYNEGEFEYATGKTDHYYRTGRVNGVTVYYIKYYTTSEPDKNNDLWLREVNKGRNGIDGDGVEYVYIRTATNQAPYITTSSDTYQDKTYLDDDYLPLSSEGRTTDDPLDVTKQLPYEWVIKRTKADPDPETGERIWHKYGEGPSEGRMSLWTTYSENAVRLDISNEMDMIPTTSALRIDTARTVETTVRLYDGSSEIDISAATVSTSGGPASSIATFSQAASGKGRKLSWAFIAGQTMAAAYNINITYTYKGEVHTVVFTVSASKGEAVWQLKPSLSAIPFQRNSDNTLTPASRAVGLSLVKIDGGSTATYTQVQTGITVRYSTSSMPSSASAGTGWSSGNITVANSADNLYIAMFNASGVLLDRETVPVVKDGEKGRDGTNGRDGRDGRDGTDGAAGHVGRWYYFAGDWDAGTSYLFEATKAPYVKRGNNFYMLDCAAWPSTQQSSSTYTSRGQDPASYGSGNPWSPMTAVFKYIISEAIFTNNAYLGSFVFNSDWLISQKGTKNGVVSTDYTAFDPAHPNDNTGSNFIPNYAVDGKTGKAYLNDLYAKNANLTGELLIQYGNNDGLKLDSSGKIMRWNGSSWVNFFAQRYARVVSGSSYTCGQFDDYLLASTDDMKIYMPESPENGRQISVRNIGTGRQCVLKSTYQFVTGGGPDVGYEAPYYWVVLYNDDRAELVFYNNKWYWNAYGT